MHKIQPYQKVRVFYLMVAVPADEEPGTIQDEIHALLEENGVANANSNILDWGYCHLLREKMVKVDNNPQEGEVFDKEPL
jgi:hypothetical protein